MFLDGARPTLPSPLIQSTTLPALIVVAPTIQIVTVSTSFLDPTLGFLSLLGLKAPTITASHQERYVGGSAPGQG